MEPKMLKVAYRVLGQRWPFRQPLGPGPEFRECMAAMVDYAVNDAETTDRLSKAFYTTYMVGLTGPSWETMDPAHKARMVEGTKATLKALLEG